MKVIVPGVCPEDYTRTFALLRLPRRERTTEGASRELRNVPFGRDVADTLHDRAQSARLREEVRDARSARGGSRPPVHEPKRVRSERTTPSLVVVREEFRLICRHVHVHRTFGAATFARETQVEGLFHRLVTPPLSQWVAFEHLEQQACAPPRGVHFVARRHIAGTHRARVMLPAFTRADAPIGSVREAAIVGIVGEVRVWLPRMVLRSPAEILI